MRFLSVPIFFFTFVLLQAANSVPSQAEELWAYIGTYTGAKSKGIYLSRFESTTGELSPAKLVAEMKNPSFLAIHPNQRFLYACSETANHKDGDTPSGAIHAFRIDTDTGDLVALNSVLSGGGAPCHLVVDATGRFLLTANYLGGNVAVHQIADDGKLGSRTDLIQHVGSSVNKQRQEAPHAHSVNLDPPNRRAFVADLGIDKIMIYEFNSQTGKLTPNEPPFVELPPGSGPRHFSFHSTGKFAYVINELALTVTAFRYNATNGELLPIQTISTLPNEDLDRTGFSTAEILVHPSGRFVYGSNRGHNSIVAYSVDLESGKLTYIENESTGGKTPRNFAIDPSGRYLLAENQDSDSIVVSSIDTDSGMLAPTGRQIEVGAPVCLRFLKR